MLIVFAAFYSKAFWPSICLGTHKNMFTMKSLERFITLLPIWLKGV